MKNMIKIFSVILVVTLGIIAFNCSGSKSETTETTDSTAVSVDTVVVDTTKVSGGAGLEGGNAPQR